MFKNKYHIHFIGIGGIGMSGIAEFLISSGYKVSGSDVQESGLTRRLSDLNAKIYIGHHADSILNSDLVVISSAINKENIELQAAQNNQIPVVHRSQMLAEIMRCKYSIAVSGSHGKTTTTNIISTILQYGGLDPTVIIGGNLKQNNKNLIKGTGKFIVVEADESDGSMVNMSPTIAVVTNIDKEHLDNYKNIDNILKAFKTFLNKISFYGFSILCYDNEYVQKILPDLKQKYITYGLDKKSDVFGYNIKTIPGFGTKFEVCVNNKKIGEFTTSLPGIHNVYNSLAGIATGLQLEIPLEKIKAALQNLEGVQRRLEIKGNYNKTLIIDDYGHHPCEIKATLRTIKENWPDNSLFVVFQPHRYSRTQSLFDDFTKAFDDADSLLILPVYSAGEKEIEGVNSYKLYEKIKDDQREIYYKENFDKAIELLKSRLKKDDILLTLGAGDVWKIGEELVIKILA